MENIKREFFIKALVDVSEDSYSDGELRYVNYYETNLYLKASNITEAVIEFFNNKLCFNIDLEYLEFDTENNCFYCSVLCDVDNNEVNEKDNKYKEWKKGKINLYSNNISLYVYELNLIKTLDK